jgi:outer membrane scaffolding protein for murein synthesis (MipA/OmpV family)
MKLAMHGSKTGMLEMKHLAAMTLTSALLVCASPTLAQQSETTLDQPLAGNEDAARPAAGPPASVQGEGGPPPFIRGESVFDDNWVTLGIGLGVSTSYDGSDNYRLIPAPIIRGKLAGIGISPSAAGVTLDFVPEREEGLDIAIGPTVRFRSDRAGGIRDDVVEAAGELDSAIEVGVAASATKRGILTRADNISLNLTARADVAGAHNGIIAEPGITYFRPIGSAIAASLTLSAEFVDDDFADYYYSVSPAQSAASGLPQFEADGGLNSLGANVFVAADLDGNTFNGGFSLVFIGGYSRLVGDAADTPYTSVRGSADQFFGAMGVGYTF